MRICFLSRSLNTGGAERQLLTLAKTLQRMGHEVHIATFYSAGPMEEDLNNTKICLTCFKKRDRWDIFPFLFRLIKFIHRIKPDVFYGYQAVPDLLAAFAKLILPKMVVVFGIAAGKLSAFKYDRFTRFTLKLESLASHFADLVISNSREGAQEAIRRGFPTSFITVIPNGIDTTIFKINPDSGRQIRQLFGANDFNKKWVGLVARLDPIKDHKTFLTAASIITKQREDIDFICVGGGPEPYQKELKYFGDSLGLKNKVLWIGEQKNITGIYNALDTICLCSKSEGMPNVIGEAMACGVPCVVTDVGDCALMVGNLGQVVQPENPQALAEAILKSLTNPNTPEVQEIRRKRIVENYSMEKLGQLTEKVLLDIAEKRNSKKKTSG